MAVLKGNLDDYSRDLNRHQGAPCLGQLWQSFMDICMHLREASLLLSAWHGCHMTAFRSMQGALGNACAHASCLLICLECVQVGWIRSVALTDCQHHTDARSLVL